MPTVSQTIKFRNRRRYTEQNRPWIKAGLSLVVLICVLGMIGSLVGFWYYSNLTHNLPSTDYLPSLLESPSGSLLQPTRLYDRNHEHVILTLENPAAEHRRYLHVGEKDVVGEDQFSPYLIDATVALFDPGFWNHAGYSLAGWSNGSHPTLAQWLISELVINDETPSVQRNIRERLLAVQITEKFGREKVLEWYLNSAQFGELVYGADAAALVYLGKSAASLSLAEAAMLTAIGETPHITPSTVSQMLKQQQRQVIQMMFENGFITQDEVNRSLGEEIFFQNQTEAIPIAPIFTSFVLQQLSQKVPIERIRRGGYEITTTLDYDLQIQADCTLKTQITHLQELRGLTINEDDLECEAGQLLPTLQPMDEIPATEFNSEIIILDPHTAEILSMVGNGSSGMKPAIPPMHPAGTILAPFLYLTAFARGMSPGTLLWDIPDQNGDEEFSSTTDTVSKELLLSYHGPVRARTALVNDYTAASEDVLRRVGMENVRLTEKRFGISLSEENQAHESSFDSINTSKITLIDIVSAYGVLGNQGVMAGQPSQQYNSENDTAGLSPTAILRIVAPDRIVWLSGSTSKANPIVSPQLAYLATHILSDEHARWPSLGHPNALEIGQPAAVKAGFSEDGDDAWVVGYTPELVVGVWAGNSQADSGAISMDISAGIWHAVMQYASQQKPVHDFAMPSGVTLLQICDPSGLLITPLCPTVDQEIFLSGTEPTQPDNLYQKITINRQTGLLATVFTPAEMLEDKVFLVLPPQAISWAKNAGLPLPPDTYDPIFVDLPIDEDVSITSPQIFDHVATQVAFSGSATGTDFLYYRLQVGQGLYPQQWIQIGEDNYEPVQDGNLGIWNTDGIEGLYVIQLIVVRQDQLVDRAVLQVTVDNTPPELEILTPIPGEKYIYEQGGKIMLQVSANDNLEIENVEFFIDGELEATLLEPPYIILWPSRSGSHTLQVRAYDLAGNMTESTVVYSIDKK